MPFAPSILSGREEGYIVDSVPSPFMIMAFDVPEEAKHTMGGVIHIDGTTRPHTVEEKVNKSYYNMIDAFNDLAGVPFVLNARFNKHGLPTICSPRHALDHLKWGCVDFLAIESFIVRR